MQLLRVSCLFVFVSLQAVFGHCEDSPGCTQQDLPSPFKEKMLRMEHLLVQMQSKMAVQQDVIQRLSTKVEEQNVLIEELRRGKSASPLQEEEEGNKPKDDETQRNLLQSGSTPKPLVSSIPETSHVQRTPLSMASRNTQARSDDAGLLEVVLNHLSQQMMAMNADIQALKNSDAQQATNVATQVQDLQLVNHLQDHEIQVAQTSTYIHWGSSTCGDQSQLVYSGVVGTGASDLSGSPVNHLCMTLSPAGSNHTVPTNNAYIYGVEYNTADSHQDKDAVCSVCRSNHTNTVMIPGTNVCVSGWNKLYSGYLMAGYRADTAATEYICVDERMGSRIGGDTNQGWGKLYFVLSMCGSLPCEPYINHAIVTCVVCSA